MPLAHDLVLPTTLDRVSTVRGVTASHLDQTWLRWWYGETLVARAGDRLLPAFVVVERVYNRETWLSCLVCRRSTFVTTPIYLVCMLTQHVPHPCPVYVPRP